MIGIFYEKTSDMEPFPTLEKRMDLYHSHATKLSVNAINDCLINRIDIKDITCLITVSCTGMSAPGLDISIIQEMDLPNNIQRSSVNFMGCYAAIHALKMADNICRSDADAKVLIVCTELCTIHFQKKPIWIVSLLLYYLQMEQRQHWLQVIISEGDGVTISNFYSEVALQGKEDMAWHLSGKRFSDETECIYPSIVANRYYTVITKCT